jgi:hypothetical protein
MQDLTGSFATAPAGVQGDALGVALRENAEAVVLDFVNPARAGHRAQK